MLDGVEAGGVEGDEADVFGPEHRPRAGGKIPQPRADGQDGVRLCRQAVGAVPTHHPDGPGPGGVGGDQAGLAGHRLHHRQPVPGGEAGQLSLGHRVVDTPTGDQQRPLGRAQGGGGALELAQVRAGTRRDVHGPAEELTGVVPRLGLGVLGQSEHRRAAVSRVEQHPERLGQGLDDLFRPGDPVPVAGHRSKGIVGRYRWGPGVLDLLEDRVGEAAGVGVAHQQQQGQPVGHGHAGGGHHVEGPGADGRGRHHDLASAGGFGVTDGGQGHAPLVLAPPGGKGVARLLQGVAQAGHVPVAEDGEHPREEGQLPVVDHRPLRHQPVHDGVGHGQADGRAAGGHRSTVPLAPAMPPALTVPLAPTMPLASVMGQRGSGAMCSHASRTQWWAGSSQKAMLRVPPGPASTLR